jgi:hypothetical protein
MPRLSEVGCRMTNDDCPTEETDDPLYADRRNFYKSDRYDRSAIDNQTASALIWTPIIHRLGRGQS